MQVDWSGRALPLLTESRRAGRAIIPISVGGTPDDVIKPIEAATLLESVRQVLSYAIWLSPDRRSLVTNPLPLHTDTMAIGLWVEVRERGRPVASCRVLADRSVPPGTRQGTWWPGPPEIWWTLEGDPAHLSEADLKDAAWTIMIQGDAEAALWDFNATEYWKGNFEIPASMLLRSRSDDDPHAAPRGTPTPASDHRRTIQ